MPQVETSGYKRFWELKQFVGHGPGGKKKCVEGFRDMVTGKFHADSRGWNGAPPNLKPGEKVIEVVSSDKYKQNYRQIFGHD